MALSSALNSLGPVSVQVVAALGFCAAASYGTLTSLRKDYKYPSGTTEWKKSAKTLPNPIKDPQGKFNV
eukprot:CAMPEP_0196717212 /NCGR_PEP_ID=MMETSP1091-20130531/632_1 /TAXON_ID=302021 /ORGANISM="Rhodomonas sp., Strain CCMP768" /LENGTH=68 /DNA_ID=CAMNT_0042057473 /DNA_START=24 /DNA_END=230 /DNA_ORIENTATION=-